MKYWSGHIGERDDFGMPIEDIFIDGKTAMGPWAIMSPSAWRQHGVGQLGTGLGQKYQRQTDGRWGKVEG
jgi:hypothetical protein